jgi:tryptophan-rich sensory protein
VIGDIAGALVWCVVVAGAGAWLTDLTPWYRALKKPTWQPPDWLFGPAWTLILGLAALAGYLAWRGAPDRATRVTIAALFVANAVANIVWSPLFFKFRRPDWALMEVPLLWLSILAMIVTLYPVSRTASTLLLPYLAWVSFASFLNLTIVRLNRPFGG